MASERHDTPVADQQPRPPFPKQHQRSPGLESKLDPRPRFEAEAYRPAGKLRDKVALITGGDSGIGRAVALIYAREGADVAIAYLPEEQSDADETRRVIEREGRRVLMLPGDLTDPKFCKDAVDTTIAKLGKLDILVSNAAHQNRKDKLAELTDTELADDVRDQRVRVSSVSLGGDRQDVARRRDHRDELRNRHPRLAQASRLFGDQGRRSTRLPSRSRRTWSTRASG